MMSEAAGGNPQAIKAMKVVDEVLAVMKAAKEGDEAAAEEIKRLSAPPKQVSIHAVAEAARKGDPQAQAAIEKLEKAAAGGDQNAQRLFEELRLSQLKAGVANKHPQALAALAQMKKAAEGGDRGAKMALEKLMSMPAPTAPTPPVDAAPIGLTKQVTIHQLVELAASGDAAAQKVFDEMKAEAASGNPQAMAVLAELEKPKAEVTEEVEA
jgi:predicted NBD/HSP70 family sugar kinase